jgi:dimethylaniline monooxygenase (N-oxide forming)
LFAPSQPATLEYPHHLSQPQFQEYLEDYARHFNVLQKVVFKASVQQVVRTENDKQWRLEMLSDGQPYHQDFDKVALCHGYQTVAEMPVYEGSDKFKGILMHSQQYRSYV